MDGYRFCAEVRRRPEFQTIPLVIFTGTFNSSENEKFSRDVGADAFFDKTTKAEILLAALQLAASRPKSRRVEHSVRDELSLVKEYCELLAQKIEERHQALQAQTAALIRSEERSRLLATIVESSDDAITSETLQGIILSWNQGAARLYGYEPVEIIGKSMSMLIPPGRQQEMGEIIRQAKNGEPTAEIQTTRIRKDGSESPVFVRVSPIKNEAGECFGISIIARDISREVEMRRKLVASENELRAFAAHLESIRENEATRIAREVHDELGQSLTALNLELVWLEKKLTAALDDDQRDPLLGRMQTMRDLIAKTTSAVQKISTELRPGVLDDLGLTAALEWYASEFQRRSGIPCHWEEKQEIQGLSQKVSTAIFRIFQEILTNIARHSGASSANVSLHLEDHLIHLEVSDDGKGFSMEHAANCRSLGLLGMRERILLIGGTLSIHSLMGVGTTVSIKAPFRIEREETANIDRR